MKNYRLSNANGKLANKSELGGWDFLYLLVNTIIIFIYLFFLFFVFVFNFSLLEDKTCSVFLKLDGCPSARRKIFLHWSFYNDGRRKKKTNPV